MDEELGAPMFRAVVVKKNVTENSVTLSVRYHRKNITYPKKKRFDVIIKRADYTSPDRIKRYDEVKNLKPGDELFVDPYGEEWTDPVFHNIFLRRWNLKFA